ncbi:hypothetical protein HG531_012038 [Fusarium graminearum]|nr:hypothetical protein HG531_012038 [Fusarium graminearum]
MELPKARRRRGQISALTSTHTGMLLRWGQGSVFESFSANNAQEDGDVKNGNHLKSDTTIQGAPSSDKVDQEESAEVGGTELDHTKNTGGKEFLRLTGLSEDTKELDSIDGDCASSRPLAKELSHETQHKTISVSRDGEQFTKLAPS